MKKREDGRETRRRLLKAACEVFAQKGYRDAKVADICRQARANVASVNYYFGNKASLYREAWQHALANFGDPVLNEGAAGTCQDLLQQYIIGLIRNFTANGESGCFSRLYLMEMVHPTGLIQDAWQETIEPKRRRLHGILREIAGPSAAELDILLCEMSIVNQCRALVTVKRSDLEYMLRRPLTPDLIASLADHIAEFSLAGVKAVGNKSHPES
ncbi:MAG: CerR family C-terminal domain-containing protein [Desulfosarcinaceae bacterium]